MGTCLRAVGSGASSCTQRSNNLVGVVSLAVSSLRLTQPRATPKPLLLCLVGCGHLSCPCAPDGPLCTGAVVRFAVYSPSPAKVWRETDAEASTLKVMVCQGGCCACPSNLSAPTSATSATRSGLDFCVQQQDPTSLGSGVLLP